MEGMTKSKFLTSFSDVVSDVVQMAKFKKIDSL